MSLNFKRNWKRINFKLCLYIFCILLPLLLSPLAASQHKAITPKLIKFLSITGCFLFRDRESRCGYVMLLVALYWLLEPVPVAATALIPVILFPILGVVSSNEICSNYMKETFMMFIGGLIVAIAVEDSKLHERIALKVLLLMGTEIKWLMLGFMLTTMFLSMWISNTATTAMMVPIVEAVINEISRNKEEDIEMNNTGRRPSLTESKQVEEPEADSNSDNKPKILEYQPLSNIKLALLLSICYSANIGGTGTLTGTGPNLVLKGLMEELHPESADITFASWMMYNVPGMLLCIFIAWFYLWMIYIRCSKESHGLRSEESIKTIISKRYADLGSISAHETQVLILFLILVFLWIFREPKFIAGWADVIGSDTKIGDSVPAIGVAFFMFFFPADPRNIGGRPILDWKTAQAKLPWGVILLIGGGFALADAAQKSGLSRMVGIKLSGLSALSPGAIAAVICFMTAMLTEIMTNTTTATILLPVFSQMATSIGVNPLFLMLPVSVVCSYAFMLPVATPPNAIAFESGNMRTIDMVKPGLIMNIVCCAVQLLMVNTLGVVMFDLNNFPKWANKTVLTSSSIATPYLNDSALFENLSSGDVSYFENSTSSLLFPTNT